MNLQAHFKPFTLKRKTAGAREIDEPTFTVVAYGRGFIQPVSGGQIRFLGPTVNEQATHRLYTEISLPAVGGDIVEQDGVSWSVVQALEPDGISAMGRHKEIGLQRG